MKASLENPKEGWRLENCKCKNGLPKTLTTKKGRKRQDKSKVQRKHNQISGKTLNNHRVCLCN